MCTDRSEPEEQYVRGYEQIPEDVMELETLLQHLPFLQEDWS